MPLFIGDYKGDTGHLTMEQHGIYLNLLMHQWRQGHYREDEMVTISRLNGNAEPVLAPIKRMLRQDQDGFWYSPRCDKEKRRVGQIYDQRTLAGASRAQKAERGANGTFLPANSQRTTSETNEQPARIQRRDQRESSQSQSQSEKKRSLRDLGSAVPQIRPESGLFPEPDGAEFAIEGQQQEPPKRKRRQTDPAVLAAVKEVFAYYLAKTGQEEYECSFTTKRRQKGMARIEDALGKTQGDLDAAKRLMCAAVDAILASKFHTGRLPKTEGKKYLDWEIYLFGSTERFEKWLRGGE